MSARIEIGNNELGGVFKEKYGPGTTSVQIRVSKPMSENDYKLREAMKQLGYIAKTDTRDFVGIYGIGYWLREGFLVARPVGVQVCLALLGLGFSADPRISNFLTPHIRPVRMVW